MDIFLKFFSVTNIFKYKPEDVLSYNLPIIIPPDRTLTKKEKNPAIINTDNIINPTDI